MGIDIERMFNSEEVKRYYFPGKIVMGGHVDELVADLVANDACIGVVVDQFFSGSDLYRKLSEKIGAERMTTWILDGTPYLQDVETFVETMPCDADSVISIGGGSASDFAKAAILLRLYGRVGGAGMADCDLAVGHLVSEKPKYISIPTTAGSGAEASRYCVVYDKVTKGKVFGRTWNVIADWIFLDPQFLRSMPKDMLVVCAFDAFVHLFETTVVRYERSGFGDMISFYWIPRIMQAMHDIVIDKDSGREGYSEIMCGATMAGLAISNIRTGNIHEAAGALLEMSQLSHGETLFVFFRKALEYYQDEIADRTRELVAHLKLFPEFIDLESLEDIVCWWEHLFEKVGLSDKIRRAVTQIDQPYSRVRNHIFQRVYTDKVWIGKESPRLMGESDVDEFIRCSLERFGFVEQ